jgi:hypothetical protein
MQLCPSCDSIDIHEIENGTKNNEPIISHQCFDCSTTWQGELLEWWETPEGEQFIRDPYTLKTLKEIFDIGEVS